MKKNTINKIFFTILLLVFCCFFIHLAIADWYTYSADAQTNIAVNLFAFALIIVISSFLISDKTKSNDISKYYYISMVIISLSCCINIFQMLYFNKHGYSVGYVVIDITRFTLEVLFVMYVCFFVMELFYVVPSIYKRTKRFIIELSMFSFILYISYIIVSSNFEFSYNLTITFSALAFVPTIVLIILLVFIILKYSKLKQEHRSLIVFFALIILSSTVRFFTSFDLGYPICSLALLSLYNYMYIKQKFNLQNSSLYASQIQQSLVNNKFDQVNNDNVDIFAKIIPAQYTTGAFYDFYMLDDTHLAISVVDIPGEGFPAALRMVEISSFLHGLINTSEHVNGIAQILSYRIKKFDKNFEPSSLWLGILNTNTNVLSYVDAGHKNFLLIRDKKVLQLEHLMSPKIGNNKNGKFRKNEILLMPGDNIMVYNRGIARQGSKSKKTNFDDTLINSLEQSKHSSKNFVNNLLEKIKLSFKKENIEEDLILLNLLIKKQKDAAHFSNLHPSIDCSDSPINQLDNKLNLECKETPNQISLFLSGSFTFTNIDGFNQEISRIAQSANGKLIIINCSKLDKLSSVGIHALVKLQQKYEDNLIVSFIDASQSVCKSIKKYGLQQVFVLGEKYARKQQ